MAPYPEVIPGALVAVGEMNLGERVLNLLLCHLPGIAARVAHHVEPLVPSRIVSEKRGDEKEKASTEINKIKIGLLIELRKKTKKMANCTKQRSFVLA